MIVPIPPAPADARPPRGRAAGALAAEDDEVLRRLDAGELLDIHRGLEWCDRELSALGRTPTARRRRVVSLRRRWAHRWHVATGRPAISLGAHRAWRFAAIAGVGAALVALLDGPREHTFPPQAPVVVMPPQASLPEPLPAPSPVPVAPGPPTPAMRAVDDTSARVWVRGAARALEACRRSSGTLVGCEHALTGDIWRHVALSGLSESTFRLITESGSGNTFTIDRSADGLITRTCSSAGVRRCPRDGRG